MTADALKAGLLLLFAALVQVSVTSNIQVASGHPDLLLVLVISVALLRGPGFGAAAGFWAGLVLDIASFQTLGLTSLLLTLAGYFQLFAEPYVMTQGGPLRSTFSMLYLMYEEGFRWWNLGNASAVAFLLFVLMSAMTSGLLWLARRRGVE